DRRHARRRPTAAAATPPAPAAHSHQELVMHTFRAMNTDVTVVAAADVALAIAGVFADAERRFSRFLPDSELSRLNRARGPVAVSAPMFDALVAARDHVGRTRGIFEPAIGGALAALGYDRSFAPGALDRDAASPPAPRARGTTPPGSLLELTLD